MTNDTAGLRRVDVIQQLEILRTKPCEARTIKQIAIFEQLLIEMDRQAAIESDHNFGSQETGPEDEDRAGPEAPGNSKPFG